MANALLFKPLLWSAISASSSAPGFSAANLLPWPVPRMGRVWRSTPGATEQNLIVDLGSDCPVDIVALFGIGQGHAAPSSAWSWSIDLATDADGPFSGSFWPGSTLPLLAGSALPVSGFGKALWLAPPAAPKNVRYVRIRFSGLSNAPIQISLAAIGRRFQPHRNYSFGAAFGVRDLGQIDYTPRGVIAMRRGRKLRGMGMTFRSLQRDELEEQLQPIFEEVGNTDPVVLVSDPDPHPQRQNRMGIGHLTGNLGSVHRTPGAFQADLNFVAVD